ncbi:hypothetical protein VTK73DRAFT_7019 [Phialemonium thermophilum]|uniref:Survival Motor Neuron Gemin2-binding domain-containing protein n=1 Tax=Phialemonium thermophilum TaxID=223376 RepID=A0ABR3XUV3_9PEZI
MENDEDVWDDSALVESWNQALEEYKKYHSVHAKGGTLDDIPSVVTGSSSKPKPNAKLETKDSTQPSQAKGPVGIDTEEHADADAQQDRASMPVQGRQGSTPSLDHETLLGSVQDENLKRLLMSWYYAGYYTGLYEGQQQQKSRVSTEK